jgi:hypothetical protein
MALKAGMVTIDRADPRALTTFWTEAAGCQVAVQGGVKRLVGLGVTVLDEQEVPGLRWTVLADPNGNEFCVGG